MPDYVNPFKLATQGTSASNDTYTVENTEEIDDSIMNSVANSTEADNGDAYNSATLITYSDLEEDDIELLKKELERKIQEAKSELENKQNTRGVLTNIGNDIKSLFDGGDKKTINQISNYETLLNNIEDNPDTIIEAYSSIMGSDLDSNNLNTLRQSKSIESDLSKEEKEEIISQLETQLDELEDNFNTTKSQNGGIGKLWDGFKNLTGIGASSNKTQAEIDTLKEQIESYKKGESDLAATYKNITGNNLTTDNLNKFLNGETTLSDTQAGEKINGYNEGQKMSVDTVADIVSGITAVGVVAFGTAVGICAAPFTGGASLGLVAAGLGMAAGSGAVIKTAIKAGDSAIGGREYGLKNVGYDIVTGAANGAMGVFSNGLAGSAGKAVMKAAGMEALETTVVKSAALTGTKALVQEATEDIAISTTKQMAVKVGAFTVGATIDGGLSGAMDAFSRDIGGNLTNSEDEKDKNISEILQDTAIGTIGGALGGVLIGGAMKGAGKLGSALGNTSLGKAADKTIKNVSKNIGDTLSNGLDGTNINNNFIPVSLKNVVSELDDNVYSVTVGNYTVQLAKDELSDEMLEAMSKGDNTLILNKAQTVLEETLQKGTKDSVADSVTDETTRVLADDVNITNINESFTTDTSAIGKSNSGLQTNISETIDDSSYTASTGISNALDEVDTSKVELPENDKNLSKLLMDKDLDTNIIQNYLNKTRINITTIDSYWGRSTTKTNLKAWLRSFQVFPDDIQPDAFKFFQKLNPDVIQHLTNFGDNNDYIAALLSKQGVFSDVDFSALSKNAEFLNLLSKTETGGISLLSQVNNVSFIRNQDFDTEGMTKLLNAFEKTKITDPGLNRWDFSLLSNLTHGHHSITDVLNSTSMNYSKVAQFLEDVSSIKINNSNGTKWSFSDILKEDWLYNSMFDENIDYDKTIQLFKTIANNSDCYSDISPLEFESKLESNIVNLSNHLKNTKYEQMDGLLYFINSKTKDGVNIVTGYNDRMTHNEILENLTNIASSPVESSNIEMLIQLVQDGVVDKHVFEYMPSTGKLSSAVVDDLDKLYEAYSMGIDPKEMFVPSFKNLKEAMNGGNDSILFKDTYKELKVGDVFQVDGEDCIRIKTSDTESNLLNISKETYFKLFPPIERYASTQNNIGNCWEITGINSLLCENDTRVSVLSLFSQDGDDIVIKFPNSEYDEIRFKNGELPDNANLQYYSKGALGVQMLEYADGREMQSEWIDNAYKKINKMISEADSDAQREELLQVLDDVVKFVESNQGNVVFDMNNGIHCHYYNGEYDTIFTANRDGGLSNELYARLGYNNAKCININDNNGLGWLEYKNTLANPNSFDKYIISWASAGKGIEESVNSNLGIVTNHAYRIKPAKVNSDGRIETFKLINPWGISETELTYKQILDYGKVIYIAEK